MADLTEFFRDYRVDDTVFGIFAKGSTRNKGLLLSRFFAWTVLPNYSVGLFCINEEDSLLTVEGIRKRIELVRRTSEQNDFHWTWLVLMSHREIPATVVNFVSRYDKRELGLGIGSTSSGQIVTSENQLGRSIRNQLNLGKALGQTKWKN